MSAEGYWERYKWRAVIGICAGIGAIAGFIILLVYALLLAGFFLLSISSFIFSLICMDAMAYYARTEIKTAYDKLPQGKQKEFFDTLPLADRIATIHPEPVGVFDHHEIRRSLTISLTIVYFALLSLSVFKSGNLLIKGNPLVELFTWIYLAVIAFYFGSRGLEKYAEVKISKKEEEEKQNGEMVSEGEGAEPEGSDKPKDTIPVGQELSLVEKLKILSEELRKWLKFWKQEPKSPEDIAKKLLDISEGLEGLRDIVDKKTKEFDDFKAEISGKLEKLEERVGSMIKRP